MSNARPTQWGSAGSQSGALDWMAQQLPAGGRILNVGAGVTAPSAGNRTVIGVDVVAAGYAGPFCRADALSLPFATAAFDGVLCKDVIEHTPDPIGVLQEVRRVARVGARLVVTVPRAIPRAVWDDPTHIRGFTRHALVTALHHSGWAVESGPDRIGGFPGAGRLGLEPHLRRLMRLPGFGHWFGTNWYVEARA